MFGEEWIVIYVHEAPLDDVSSGRCARPIERTAFQSVSESAQRIAARPSFIGYTKKRPRLSNCARSPPERWKTSAVSMFVVTIFESLNMWQPCTDIGLRCDLQP